MQVSKNNFYRERYSNFYDKLLIDVKSLYSGDVLAKSKNATENFVKFIHNPYCNRIYRNRTLPFSIRMKSYNIFRRTQLDISWFQFFSSYWKMLGGRPLWGVDDFYFLRNIYRLHHQNNQLPDTDDPFVHREAWQRPEMIYQLFHQVYKESFLPETQILSLIRKYFINPDTILEFGCATAPVLTAYYEFFKPKKNFQAFFADIQTISFHYAINKFKFASNVIPLLLLPQNSFELKINQKIDVLVCKTVFEHLNQPLSTVKLFYEIITDNGLLFFDYHKGNAEGMDTLIGLHERDDVLKFIDKNFNLVFGNIDPEKSTGLTVVRKK